MNRLLSVVSGTALLSLLASPLVARASTWEIDSAHSSAQFSVRHLMVSNVRGEFGKVAGTVNLNDSDPTKSTVEVEIDATSINTREAKRDEHLRSPDFFDVAKFPKISFKSTQISKVTDGKYSVVGNLTIHGVTKPVTLTTELSPEIKDPWGNVKRGGTATTTVNRKDFGLTWNKALETGGVVVGDAVNIVVDVELARKGDKPEGPAGAKPVPKPAAK
ncbi:MAG: YceI family protein [Polyangia bacterium]